MPAFALLPLRRGAAAILAILLAVVGLVSATGPASADAAPVALTGPGFTTYEQGTLATGSGAERNEASDLTGRIRLADKVAVDPSWASLSFDGPSSVVAIFFAYDADGRFISQSSTTSAKWTSLPFTYDLPAGTAFVDWVLSYADGGSITVADQASWLSVAVASTQVVTPPATTAPAVPVALDDAAWNTFEQGTIDAGTGKNRGAAGDGTSDSLTRIRLQAPLPVDPTLGAIRFEGGTDTQVTVFAYDATGAFLSPSSGWKSVGQGFDFVLPAGTAFLDYAVRYSDARPILVADQSPWLTLTATVVDPRDSFQVDAHPIAAQFTIPGIVASQGGNFVAGQLWEATASDDGEGAANGTVSVYDMDYAARTATKVHQFKHNFGHLNSFSYDPASDQVIFGNGSGSYTQLPRFYVVDRANIDLDGTNTLTSVHATTFEVPADFGAKANVIWTDTPDEPVMLTDDGITVRRLRLAKGTEHLDLGTFHEVGADEYNGTWTVLDTYRINTAYDVVQSASWVSGHLVIGLGHGPMSVGVIDLTDDAPHMRYVVHRDAANSQYFESLFYDPVHHWFGGGDAATGTAWFWDDTNLTLTPAPTPPAVATALPTISRHGRTLNAHPGTWDVADAQLSYQWLADGRPIDGETAPTLVVRPELHFVAITVEVTASVPGRPDGTATSAAAYFPVGAKG